MAITKVSAALANLDGGVVINESSADADFRVESNGNTHMLFVDGGNDKVGIGTTSPSDDLEVASTLGTIRITDTDGGYVRLRSNSGNLILQADEGASVASSNIQFHIDSTERMRIDSSGNQKLTGTTDLYVDLFADSGTGQGSSSFRFYSDGTSAEQLLASIVMQQESGGGSARKGEMLFQVSDNAAPATALQILNNKNIYGRNGIYSYYDSSNHVAIRGLSGGNYIQYGSGTALSFVAIDTFPNSGASTKATIRTTGAFEVAGGFTSGQGGSDGLNTGVQINNYEVTLSATDISNGYVDVTTDIGRAAYLGFSFGIYDSSLNVFSANDNNWITYTDGYNNVVRVGLGSNAASGDIVRGVVFHH